jgi:hypothetical protein
MQPGMIACLVRDEKLYELDRHVRFDRAETSIFRRFR